EPAALVKGDAFVLRSPIATLAGGTIVDVHARRHRRNHAGTLHSLEALQRGAPEEAVYELLSRLEPAEPAALARETDLGGQGVLEALRVLYAEGRVVPLGAAEPAPDATLYTLAGFQRLTDRALEALDGYLREHPLRTGIPREQLKSRLGLAPKLFNQIIERWVAEGTFEERGSLVTRAGYAVRLTPQQQAEADRFLRALQASPYAPAPEHIPDRELLGYLAETGAVVPVGADIVFDAGAYRRMVDGIVAFLKEHPTITLAQVRDQFGTSRRFAQALLEHLDEQRITRRVGDERVLRSPEAAAR
ncbi:MAG TPA: SelB C-terminal domain-containing protein, partial [Dehalococcoidia bacterium]|nr:SelB C-terminal domain-containing protein [Dehalococcoidia bacterium]